MTNDDHCYELGKPHRWIIKAVNEVGTWRDCVDCGTTGLVAVKSTVDRTDTESKAGLIAAKPAVDSAESKAGLSRDKAARKGK